NEEAAATVAHRRAEEVDRAAAVAAESAARDTAWLAAQAARLEAEAARLGAALPADEDTTASPVPPATDEPHRRADDPPRRTREPLHAAETSATTARERLRRAQERARLDEREEVEARLALDGLRDGLLVELAGLGETALRHLGAAPPTTDATAAPQSGEDDFDADALERALTTASAVWLEAPPPAEPPPPGRLASLRRRFHDLGAVNPFAAEEYAEVRARLDGLEAQ